MRFKCGPNEQEIKAKRDRKVAAFKDYVENGTVVFALWPVKVAEGDCRWLENVRMFPKYQGLILDTASRFGWHWTESRERNSAWYSTRYEAIE